MLEDFFSFLLLRGRFNKSQEYNLRIAIKELKLSENWILSSIL